MDSLKKYILLLSLITMTANLLFGQKTTPKHHKPDKEEINRWKYGCIHRNKYSAIQRLKFYPFSKAKLVKLVSFNDSTVVQDRVPLLNDTVDNSRFIEVKTLKKAQLDSLTDIIYNIGERAPNDISKLMDITNPKCYDPHNAIVFIDRLGHTFAYIEICFKCFGCRLSSHKEMKFGNFCDRKYDLLRTFFNTLGVTTHFTKFYPKD